MTRRGVQLPRWTEGPRGAVGLVAVAAVLAALILPRGLPVEVVVPGLVIGGLNALTAMGLVLIFRTSRIINFAQANIGGLVSTLVGLLISSEHWSYWAALLTGLVFASFLGIWIERGILGPIRNAPRLAVTVATIGIAQILGGLGLWLSGQPLGGFGLYLPHMFKVPDGLTTVVPFHAPWDLKVHLGSLLLTGDFFIAVIAVPLALILLTFYFNRTDSGLGARASADSTERAMLLGLPVRRLSTITWIVAAVMSGAAAVLLAGVQGFQSTVTGGPEQLVAPLAAAVIAGFDSLVVAFCASLVIAVAQQAIYWSFPQQSIVDLTTFVLIVAALLLRRQQATRVGGEDLGGFVALAQARPLTEQIARLTPVRLLNLGGLAVLLATAGLLPLVVSGTTIVFLTFVVIFSIVAASLLLLTGWGGAVSLCQFGFVGLGAGTTGYLLNSHGASMLVCLAASTGVGILAAVFIGLPALRIRGLYLAVVTMAFAVPASSYFLNNARFPAFAPLRVEPPLLFGRYDLGDPKTFYYFCLIICFIAFGLARNFRATRIGRATVAMRDNERFAAAVSLDSLRVRLVTFGASGALAGLAGSLYVVAYRGIPFGGFSPSLNFQAFTMVVVGGLGSLWGAVIGALYVYLAQYFLGASAALLVTGGGIITVLTLAPGGLADLGYRVRDLIILQVLRRQGLSPNLLFARPDDEASSSSARSWFGTKIRNSSTGAREAMGRARRRTAATQEMVKPISLLAVREVEAGYGHLQILFGTTVDVAEGDVFALLGTNGAGKSTVLKTVAGLLPARAGTIEFAGENITRLTPAQRVARGVVLVPGGRGVFASLTVQDNLRLAAWLARRRRDKDFQQHTLERIYQLFPVLAERGSSRAGLLSGGEQQMLTISMALLCRPRLLMIDELSLGLAPVVVGELLAAVRQLNAEGMTVVLVEQSMNIAATIAPEAVFLEKGQVRFRGPTTELANQDHLVRSVFLDGGGSASRIKTASRPTPPTHAPSPAADPDGHSILEVVDLRKSYGGVTPVDGVSLKLPQGQITGVIGANGAGKTTLFDVICGFVRQDGGEIHMLGCDVTADGPARRFRLGLGRTFQDLRLVPSMTVTEILALATERHIDVRDPVAGMLGLPAVWRSELKIAAEVDRLVEEFNLGRVANSFISELSTGTRRVVELACAVAHQPSLLVLDEPSSGLAQSEAEAMVPVLLDLRARTGATIAIIEHDIPLIMALSDQVVCLHLGQVLAHGTCESVLSDERVIASYLGLDDAAVQRSGNARPHRNSAASTSTRRPALADGRPR